MPSASIAPQAMQRARTLLKEHFGFDQFRPGQAQVVEQLLGGHSTLAVFPTGGGKSLCYQLPSQCLSGLTLVVSPLLALMKDQVEFMTERGIRAATLDSTLSQDEYFSVVAAVKAGEVKVLQVSVERFKNERFRAFIDNLKIDLLVVDEAHSISEWGHNFRPDYQKLPLYREQLRIPTVLLLTATSTPEVQQDMCRAFRIQPEHVVSTGFYRSNLDLSVQSVPARERPARLGRLIQEGAGRGIVYVTLQDTAESVAADLASAGVRAAAYHAGMKTEVRERVQDDFAEGRLDVVVATIAFGMGVDIPDIRFVIHYDLPKCVESYSQEIGRAGRDGQPSRCVLLGGRDNLATLENFVYGDTPEQRGIEAVLKAIADTEQDGFFDTALGSQGPLSRLSDIRELTLKTLLVQLELRGVLTPSRSYYAQTRFKLMQDRDALLALVKGEPRQFAELILNHCTKGRTWWQPDIEAIEQASGSDRSRILRALEYFESRQMIQVEQSNRREVWRVDRQRLLQPGLAESLTAHFQAMEDREIARLARLVTFFESPGCLTAALAAHFGDTRAPKQCGHCDGCRGTLGRLAEPSTASMPPRAEIARSLAALDQRFASEGLPPASLTQQVRFLAGLHGPVFTMLKARTLPGFGACGRHRYADIRAQVSALGR